MNALNASLSLFYHFTYKRFGSGFRIISRFILIHYDGCPIATEPYRHSRSHYTLNRIFFFTAGLFLYIHLHNPFIKLAHPIPYLTPTPPRPTPVSSSLSVSPSLFVSLSLSVSQSVFPSFRLSRPANRPHVNPFGFASSVSTAITSNHSTPPTINLPGSWTLLRLPSSCRSSRPRFWAYLVRKQTAVKNFSQSRDVRQKVQRTRRFPIRCLQFARPPAIPPKTEYSR